MSGQARKMRREQEKRARAERRRAARAGDMEATAALLDERTDRQYEAGARARRPAQQRAKLKASLQQRESLKRDRERTIEHAERWRREHPDAEPTPDDPSIVWIEGRLYPRSDLTPDELALAISVRDARDAARWYG